MNYRRVQALINPMDKYDFMTIEQLRAECRRLEGVAEHTGLWEACNGQEGRGPVRVYVWADFSDQVRRMALDSFVSSGFANTLSQIRVKRLFRKCVDKFVTVPDDLGFGKLHFREGRVSTRDGRL